jgi:hypothetical protein
MFREKAVLGAWLIALLFGLPVLTQDISVLAENNPEDLVVEGNAVLIIENSQYVHKGNVIVRENGTLIVKNSRFVIEQSLGERYEVGVYDNASLRIENSEIGNVNNYPIIASYNSSFVHIANSTFTFRLSNVMEAYGESKVLVENVRAAGSLEIHTYDSSNVSLGNAELYLVAAYENSTVSVRDSLIEHDIWCRDSSRLVLHHSTVSAEGIGGFLIAEDSTDVTISDSSRVEYYLDANDLSRILVENAYVRWLQLSGPSNVQVTNNSTIDGLSISFSQGQTSISNFKSGYIGRNEMFEPATRLNFTIIDSRIGDVDLKVAGNSHIFVKDSEISTISLSGYASATVYNSQVDILYCSKSSFVLVWNSRIAHPIQGEEEATVLYYSTVDMGIFNLMIIVFLMISVICTVLAVFLLKKRHQ